ncbi:MAG: hypothetical protein H5U06_09075 [Candidatus Aminicenantes bacterium]|nr:hypothetical protein [Candidatus Aminicenantes bacterium]
MTKLKIALLTITFFSFSHLNLIHFSAQETHSQPDTIMTPILTVNPAPSQRVSPGSTFEIALELVVAPGYHINSDKPEDELLVATSVEIKNDPFIEIKEILFPEAKKKKFGFSDKPISVYEGKIKIKIKMGLKESFKGRELSLEGRVRYQACNDHTCLRPMSAPFKFSLSVSPN